MLRVVSQPFCEVVLLDRWDAEPSRYFTAYRAGGASRWILGHPVVDEYATTSSPIFLTSRRLLGKIYNAGISLGVVAAHEEGAPSVLVLPGDLPYLSVEALEELLIAAVAGGVAADGGPLVGVAPSDAGGGT